MQVKSIAECSKESILQYFRLSFSYHLSLRPLFCLFYGWDLGVQGGRGGGLINYFFPEFNQIWVVSYSYACHVQRYNVLVPAPWVPLGGAKWSNINYKVNFKTLCVFSQMKDIKHVRRDSHLGGLKGAGEGRKN